MFSTVESRSAAVSGTDYLTTLASLHANRKPQTYFEIGTQTGNSLGISKCLSVAVDPVFQISAANRAHMPKGVILIETTSDSFFASHDPVSLLNGPIDLAFLDGMHRSEYLLRDFINTERHCHPGSMIVMHDCLPPAFEMTVRDIKKRPRDGRFADWWTGDVWRVVPILQRYRPDLHLTVLDCAPTGLVLVENLNPKSAVLATAYPEIEPRLISDASEREYANYWNSIRIVKAADYDPVPRYSATMAGAPFVL